MKICPAMLTLLLTLLLGAILTTGARAEGKTKGECKQAQTKDFCGSYQVKPHDFDLSNGHSWTKGEQPAKKTEAAKAKEPTPAKPAAQTPKPAMTPAKVHHAAKPMAKPKAKPAATPKAH